MNRLNGKIVSVLLLASIAITACSPAANTLKGDPNAGVTLFANGTDALQACSTCHSLDGAPELGPTLQGIAARAGSRVPGKSAETYLLTSILRPNDYVVPGYAADIMPAYSQLTAQQQQDIVAYLLTLK